MHERIHKIAINFLAQKEENALSDLDINKILKDTIKNQYMTLINGFIRRFDIDKLLYGSFYLAHKLPGTGHTEKIEAIFYSLKDRLLAVLKNEFIAEKNSLQDSLFQTIKQNPDFDEDDVSDLVKKSIIDRRKELITFIRKLNLISNQ